ncbi:MAG: PAS domain S-box protein [Sedimenticola sp.]
MTREPEYLTPKEVADLLKVSTATVRLWAEKGELPVHFVTPGGHRRFSREAIEAFAQERELTASALSNHLKPGSEAGSSVFTETEARFRALVEHMPVVVYAAASDEASTTLYISPQIEDFIGYTAEEFIADPDLWVESIHPDDRERVINEVTASHESHSVLKTEYRMISHRGELVWIRDEAAPVLGLEGQTLMLQGVMTNITEQKQIAAALEVEQNRAARYMDVASVIILGINLDGEVELINAKGCEVLGYPKEEVLGRNWFDNFLPERQRDEVKEVFRQVVAGDLEQVSTYENPVLCRNGEERIIEWYNSILRDREGNILGALSSGTDVSDRITVELKLKASEERFRALFEQAAVGVAQIATPTCTFIRINDKFCEILGRRPDEVLAAECARFTHPDDLPSVRENVARLKSGEVREFTLELRYLRPDGSPVWVSLTASPMWAEGEIPDYHIIVVKDITERKSTEAELQKTVVLLNEAERLGKIGSWEYDVARDIGWMSDNEFRMHGIQRSETFAYEEHLACVHPEDREKHDKAFREALGSKTLQFNHEYRLLASSGKVSELLTRARIERNEEGEAIRVFGTDQEITQRKAFERALRQREARYRQLFTQNKAVELLVDPEDGTIVDANNAAASYYGYSRDELLHLNISDINILGAEEEQEEMARAREEKRDHFFFKHRLKSGEVRDVEVHSGPIALQERTVLYSIVHDVTDRVQAERRLRQAAVAFENTAEGVMITNADKRILSVNRAFTEITGYSESEVIGETPQILSSGRQDRDFYRQMWGSLKSTGRWQGEIWNRRKNGEIYPEWLTISSVNDLQGNVQNYVGVFADITTIKRSQDELEYLAHHDPLTDLPNRLLFNARLKHAFERARREKHQVAVLFLDLDRFKNVNDSFGHPVGDELLKRVAARLIQDVREADTVSRFGGDEFAVLIEVVEDTDDVAKVANKLIASLKEPFNLKGRETFITASIGIALYPEDGLNASKLLRNADAALYVAKDEGRNTYRYYSRRMTIAARDRLTLEGALRKAIDKRELEVWYQPQVSMRSRELIGVEALVRWNRPGHGLISPVEFIPLAEETGLIIPMGELIMIMACEQVMSWRNAGKFRGRLAVNIAGPQMERGNIVETVQRILAEVGMPASLLELEITESFIMGNAEEALQTVQSLKDLGVTTSIDDFGTGYSSLSYLKRLPVDALKIDQGFVHDLPDDPEDAAIARAVIALGNSLGYTVIAEGVETEAQRKFLLDEQCDLAQGYLFSPPMSAADFELWIENRSATDS